MARKTSKPSQASQILFDIVWKPTKSGGFIRDFRMGESGNNLLVPLTIEEAKPNVKYYRQDHNKKNTFYETSFHPKVEWSTIQELVKTGTIWRLTQEKKDTATSLL